jgi:GT2 family glycosyltransferase
LLRASVPGHQIVVCDNGSADHSIERLTEWADGLLEVKSSSEGASWCYRPVEKPLRYALFVSPEHAVSYSDKVDAPLIFIRTGANLGYAGGNNVGIRFATEQLKADYVWLLNNDTIVERQALSRLTDAMAMRSDVAVLGSRLMQYSSPNTIQALGGGRLHPRFGRETQVGRGCTEHDEIDRAIELEHVVGASMFVRVDAVREAGLFDESYFLYREETDWCIELRKCGWKLFYCPDSIVWHKEGRSVGHKSPLHDYYAVRNMLFLIQKHYPEHLASAFCASVWRAVLPKVARLQLRRLYYVLKAYGHFLSGVRGKSDVNPDYQFLALERHI